uniref:Peptidase A1 domain-containing protein n=1 Tax=Solanum lycopersicum TaxID=4081 RepID=A0A3Q7JPG8_SOLLC
MDTGSSFVWFPCTKKYQCSKCPVSSQKNPTFIPRLSSSARVLGCLNPKCSWIHPKKQPESLCHACESRNRTNWYYYVELTEITVGDQIVKVPYRYLAPNSLGNGGTIVDSGTTFTFLNHDIFVSVMNAFVNQGIKQCHCQR